MNNKEFAVLVLTILSGFNAQLSTAHAQGTAFTYQGRLINLFAAIETVARVGRNQ